MATVSINITNLTCKLTGDVKTLRKLRNETKIRNPNAYYIRQYMAPGWDGYQQRITDAGYIASGLLPMMYNLLTDWGVDIILNDNRDLVEPVEIPDRVKDFVFREYQGEAIKAVINNYIGDVYWPRGIQSAATNAGKSLMMAGIAACYPDLPGLILLNDGTLYKQMLTDMPKLFTDWGYCQGKKIKFGHVTVAMVQTLVTHLEEFRQELAEIGVLLVDECDLSTSKTYKKVLSKIPNAFVRVGLSGSVLVRNMAKDKLKNNLIVSQFGDILFKIKNKELMALGYSTPVVIKLNIGNRVVGSKTTYEEEYLERIVRNNARNNMWASRVQYYLKSGTYPILVVARLHEHVETLYNLMAIKFGREFRVGYAHGGLPEKERDSAIEFFREGELDILVASMIIRRGQNMPLIRAILNTAGGDGPSSPLQIIGRGTRTDDSKEKVFYEDAYDQGWFLERHSKHRYIYYKNEGLKIIKFF